MQERAWWRIRGEAARLAEIDREVAGRERMVREEEEAVARGAHRVIPEPEGGTPPADVEGWSSSWKRARRGGRRGLASAGKAAPGEERGAQEATGAPQPSSPSPKPTPMDWGSESPLPQQYAWHPSRRVPGTVRG